MVHRKIRSPDRYSCQIGETRAQGMTYHLSAPCVMKLSLFCSFWQLASMHIYCSFLAVFFWIVTALSMKTVQTQAAIAAKECFAESGAYHTLLHYVRDQHVINDSRNLLKAHHFSYALFSINFQGLKTQMEFPISLESFKFQLKAFGNQIKIFKFD